MKKLLTLTLLWFFFLHSSKGQTPLQAGDIAFVGFQSGQSNQSAPDRFAFVLLKDVVAETRILFSDNGVLNPSPVRFCRNEGFARWTATGNLSRGTVVSITEDSVASSGIVSGGLGLSQSGDQILAMQIIGSDTIMLAGISSTTWETVCATSCGGSNNNKTCLPPNLVNGVNAVGFPVKRNNMFFTFDDLTGSQEEILSAINNPANWLTSDELQTWPSWSVTIVTSSSPLMNELNFSVYPTVSPGEFSIGYSSGEALELSVISLFGVKVFSGKLEEGGRKIQLGQIPSGIYFVNAVSASGRRAVKKIEVTR